MLAGLDLEPDRLQGRDLAVLAEEPAGVDRVFADAPLLVRGAGPEDVRPLRPGVVGLPVLGGLGVDLELIDRLRPLAMDRPQAVGAGVAAADDDRRPCPWP